MIKIKRNKNKQLARLISCVFEKDNSKINSKFYNTSLKNYELVSILAYSGNGDLVGGINGEIVDSVYYLDEIWVKYEFRGLLVGRKMLLFLENQLKDSGISYYYYSHLEEFKDYLQKNSFKCDYVEKQYCAERKLK